MPRRARRRGHARAGRRPPDGRDQACAPRPARGRAGTDHRCGAAPWGWPTSSACPPPRPGRRPRTDEARVRGTGDTGGTGGRRTDSRAGSRLAHADCLLGTRVRVGRSDPNRATPCRPPRRDPRPAPRSAAPSFRPLDTRRTADSRGMTARFRLRLPDSNRTARLQRPACCRYTKADRADQGAASAYQCAASRVVVRTPSRPPCAQTRRRRAVTTGQAGQGPIGAPVTVHDGPVTSTPRQRTWHAVRDGYSGRRARMTGKQRREQLLDVASQALRQEGFRRHQRRGDRRDRTGLQTGGATSTSAARRVCTRSSSTARSRPCWPRSPRPCPPTAIHESCSRTPHWPCSGTSRALPTGSGSWSVTPRSPSPPAPSPA